MNFKELYTFLRELRDNNHKEWMDENRPRYQKLRNDFIDFLNELDHKLQAHDPRYTHTPAKEALYRINNNKMFHPDRPTYKDHFSASLDQGKDKAGFYLQVGPTEAYVAGGYWHPGSEVLKKVRAAIDFDGHHLQTILDQPSFRDTFILMEDEKLKSAPQGFSGDHPHIGLLKLKNFVVYRDLTEAEVFAPGFQDFIVELYHEMLPFRQYVTRAVKMEE